MYRSFSIGLHKTEFSRSAIRKSRRLVPRIVQLRTAITGLEADALQSAIAGNAI